MSQHIDISCYILGPYYGVILTLKTTPICIALNTFYVLCRLVRSMASK